MRPPRTTALSSLVVLTVAWLSIGTRATGGSVDFNHYHTYAELTAVLQDLAKNYPNLITIEEIGRSRQGRALWAATITNRATGAAADKPGMYVDGNTHAGEVAGTEAALHLAWHLVTDYGKDPLVTTALDTRAYYVIPRVNPDGSEAYLSGRDLGAAKDLNGDGAISFMRSHDPDGPFCTDSSDARLMRPRKPGEAGEWRILGLEGAEVGATRASGNAGGVSNRNYPVGWWSQDEMRHGQGTYPLSEPEAKAQVDFVLAHPNLSNLITYHTHSGMILRPYAHRADDGPIYKDLPYFEGIGKTGTDITGYLFDSSFNGFTPDPTQPRLGTFKDWAYVQDGLISWTIEIWKVPGEGRTAFEGLDQGKLLKFVDEKLGGKGFVPWKKFNHPRYGEIEIGGFDQRFLIQNPPPQLLQAEIEKLTRFAIVQGMTSPLVRIVDSKVDDLGSGFFRVKATVQNQGYLPTAIPRAVSLGIVKPVRLTIEGGEVLSEPQAHDLGVLPGWGPVDEAGPEFNARAYGAPTKSVSWIVRGKPGTSVMLRVVSDRGGRHEVKIVLAPSRPS